MAWIHNPDIVQTSPSEVRAMKNVIVITSASSGFGALAARPLARAGHTVYAKGR